MTLDWHTADYPELRPGPPWVMEEMIAATPQLAAGVLGRTEAATLAQAIVGAAAAGAPIVTTGCGTSLHAAMAIADLLEHALARAGSEVRVEACDAFEAALAPRRGGVIVGVSHDGGTHATALALEAAAAAGAQTALITHRPDGTCAQAADVVLPTPIADRSWCHTIAYTSAILASAAIASQIAGPALDAGAVEHRLTTLHTSLREAMAAAAQLLGPAARVVCTGSGCDRVTSHELTLKLEEGPQLPAAHRDLEILLHGHLVACEPGTPIVLIALDPRGRPRRLDRAARLLAAASALALPVILISDADGAAALGSHPAVGGSLSTGAATLPQPLDALLAGAIALQLLTLATVHARGTNPDLIRREQAPWRNAAHILDTSGW
jgi:glucosamine--fructose-6-phosphate aminotransferase (isomerizing)